MAYLTPSNASAPASFEIPTLPLSSACGNPSVGRRLQNMKFVRQLPVGPYIADFACSAPWLIVEVDGAAHSTAEEVAYDAGRTTYLETQGYRVLRAGNHDVFTNLGGVLESIMLALGNSRWGNSDGAFSYRDSWGSALIPLSGPSPMAMPREKAIHLQRLRLPKDGLCHGRRPIASSAFARRRWEKVPEGRMRALSPGGVIH